MGAIPFLVRMVSPPVSAPEDVVGREESDAASDVGRGASNVERPRRVHRERRCWIVLALVYPVERRRVEHPVGLERAYGRRDARFVFHVQVVVGGSYRLITENLHEVSSELAGRADDQDFQMAPSFAIVSFSHLMLK